MLFIGKCKLEPTISANKINVNRDLSFDDFSEAFQC